MNRLKTNTMNRLKTNILLVLSLMVSFCACSDEDMDITKQESNSIDYKTNLYPIEVEGKTGYIDRTGDIVIEPQFDSADPFYYGLAIFRMKGEDGMYHNWGYINTKGEVVIEHKLTSASRFTRDGLARASLEGKSGYINKKGEFVIEADYEQQGDFQEGLASVKISGKYGFINTRGILVIEPKFKSAGRFCNGFCEVVTSDDKHNYIDKKGSLVTDIEFSRGDWFYCGLAKVKTGDKYRYINESGEFAFEGEYSDAASFSEGLAAVENQEGKWGFINTRGELVIDYKFGAGWFSSLEFHEGLAYVKEGDLWGYIDKKGSYVISPRYKSANEFVNGVARVYLVEKSAAYIDKSGKIIYKGKID